MSYNSLADLCRLMAEQYDNKSIGKLVGFNPTLKRPTCIAHAEEL